MVILKGKQKNGDPMIPSQMTRLLKLRVARENTTMYQKQCRELFANKPYRRRDTYTRAEKCFGVFFHKIIPCQ